MMRFGEDQPYSQSVRRFIMDRRVKPGDDSDWRLAHIVAVALSPSL